jgi:hypothetical protein
LHLRTNLLHFLNFLLFIWQILEKLLMYDLLLNKKILIFANVI